jgi:hypothetical protein
MAIIMIAWLATPAFITLATVNYTLPTSLCTVPGPLDFLRSMWLMYLLMAVAHTTVWWDFVARKNAKLNA